MSPTDSASDPSSSLIRIVYSSWVFELEALLSPCLLHSLYHSSLAGSLAAFLFGLLSGLLPGVLPRLFFGLLFGLLCRLLPGLQLPGHLAPPDILHLGLGPILPHCLPALFPLFFILGCFSGPQHA